ncbi:glycosyltransferase [Pseudooceanicola batsensis]|uniref:glycosyltransferase n=1 Tax=Pseudooceanicola batsensis TaxID=314255 RepID=UPI001930CEF5|nr:glycosyltransferase [Pseudooceanicola batsensis]
MLFVLRGYPQISQTYVKTEIEEVEKFADVAIVSRKPADRPYKDHRDFTQVSSLDEAERVARNFQPDVIHAHYLNQVEFTAELARRLGVPFTIRSHSFDVVALSPVPLKERLRRLVRGKDNSVRKAEGIRSALPLLSRDDCLGVLAFPYARPLLEEAGVPAGKIVDCFPCVKVEAFHDRSPNGRGVMNTGAAIPKKKMGDFLKLSKLVPETRFTLYPLGYKQDDIRRDAERMDAPVAFHDMVEPGEMPAQYKRHDWLVYTGDFRLKTVGWPMAVAEAQASGCGVCMPNLRPDLREYVGDAAILYDDIREVVPIVSQPPSDEMREAGFRHAMKSDIRTHLHRLTDLWPFEIETQSARHVAE